MPKYWGKQIFTHGSFPEVAQKQKTEREKKKRILQGLRVANSAVTERKKKEKKKEERLNDGDNNGQATHGARKPPGPIEMIAVLSGKITLVWILTFNLCCGNW